MLSSVSPDSNDICFAFGQIDVLVAEHKLDLQAGVLGVESVQQARLCGPMGSGQVRRMIPTWTLPRSRNVYSKLAADTATISACGRMLMPSSVS